MSIGQRIAFRQLLENCGGIEIPIIQRDYAQGRASAVEVRVQFLDTIYKTLNTDPNMLSEPLDLDFVYGSLEGDTPQKFSPLDGQQRLTTLFLLHWYLACLDGEFESFKLMALDGDTSKFTYQTRSSSTEFFNALVNEEIDISELLEQNSSNVCDVLSKSIVNRQWFFLSWRQDPTIQAALVMLDSIHEKFSNTSGFYQRITEVKIPYVTFQYLNLREFGLSDELYIKMNSRGKPLTAFENFKARLEQHIERMLPNHRYGYGERDVSAKDYFSHKIDTQWADLFWVYRDKNLNVFDDQIMNFIRTLSSIYYPRGTDWRSVVDKLRDSSVDISFYKFIEMKCFSTDFIEVLILLFDKLSGTSNGLNLFLENDTYYDEKRIFQKSLNKMHPATRTGQDYEESVKFFAYCKYLEIHGNNVDKERFSEWMRIISNLAVNTPYNNPYEFQKSLVSVENLSSYSNNFFKYFADSGADESIDGFLNQQLREEHIKANLILKGELWRKAILSAEQHGYFKGQIEFILSFSGILDYFIKNSNVDWSEKEDQLYYEAFISYFEKVAVIFNDNGLDSFDDFLWERALLSSGDYLLQKGRNLSFLDNNDRDASWKRLLRGAEHTKDNQNINAKRALIKNILDQLDVNDPITSLTSIVNSAQIDVQWRKMIVEQAKIIEYCKSRFIRKRSNNDVLLLTKTQTNGNHLELFTYYLKLSVLDPKLANGEMKPFSYIYPYDSNTEDLNPHIILSGCKVAGQMLRLLIYFIDGMYHLQFEIIDTNPQLLKLRNDLIDQCKFALAADGKTIIQRIECSEIEDSIDGIFKLVGLYADE